MSKVGGGSSDQQTKSDPWDGLKPYLIGLDGKTGIMPEAERLYKEATPEYFKGNTYAGLNDVQNGAIGKLLDYYNSPSSMAGRTPMPARSICRCRPTGRTGRGNRSIASAASPR